MPSKRSAIAALRKLEADRLAMDERKHELERQAALEIGTIVLGTGLDTFSNKGLMQVARALGQLGEDAAIKRLASFS